MAGVNAEASAARIAQDVRSGARTASATTREALDLARRDPYHAIISINESAERDAAGIDAIVAAGHDPGPLAGAPVIIKDNLCLTGTRTTAGSRALENFVSPYTATSVRLLQAAGAVIVAKANCDEFAMGSSTENSAFGPTLNPWDVTRVPGGSSGGSAAAVAAGFTPLALGSDTGGSIRQPAAYTGVYGFKPTYGRASRYGLVAFASSLDQVGAFARSAEDLALTLDVICRHDPLDSTSLNVAPQFVAALRAPVKGLRVAIVTEALSAGNTPGVSGALEAARSTLVGLGVILSEVSLPALDSAIAAYYLVACAEASSNLARFDGLIYSSRAPEQPGEDWNSLVMRSRALAFGPEVKRRVLLGTYALSSGYYDAYYSKALRARALIARQFTQAFGACDALLMPTTPTPAFRLNEKTSDPLAMYLNDIDTVPVNLAGLPGLHVPFGFEEDGAYSASGGLPVGVQLIAPALCDERLITLAAALERATSGAFLRVAAPVVATGS